MARKGFYFNMTTCIGCKTCQIACKDVNGLDVGITFRNVKSYESGVYPMPNVYHYSSSCNHCVVPACLISCVEGAIYIDEDGSVQIDAEECTGCKACIEACPYLVPKFDEELNIARKCNMCKELTDRGQQPRCAGSCYTRSLEWGEYDDLEVKHPAAVADIAILPSSDTTFPSVLIDPKPFAVKDTGNLMDY